MLVSVVSLAASLASCSFLVPQLVRLVRTRDAAGVSPTMAALGAVSCFAWTVYGVLAHVGPLVVTGALATAEYVWLSVLLRLAQRSVRGAVLVAAAWSGALCVAAWVGVAVDRGGATGLGAALTAAVVAQYLPAVLEAHRARSTSGISLGTWALVATNGSLWALYGWLIGDWAVIGYGSVVMAAAMGVALGVARSRATRRAPNAAGDRWSASTPAAP